MQRSRCFSVTCDSYLSSLKYFGIPQATAGVPLVSAVVVKMELPERTWTAFCVNCL